MALRTTVEQEAAHVAAADFQVKKKKSDKYVQRLQCAAVANLVVGWLCPTMDTHLVI